MTFCVHLTDGPSADVSGHVPFEVLGDHLVNLVSTTEPHHALYGGDLCALVAVMFDVTDRSTVHLLPALKNTAARSLSANISSVCFEVFEITAELFQPLK